MDNESSRRKVLQSTGIGLSAFSLGALVTGSASGNREGVSLSESGLEDSYTEMVDNGKVDQAIELLEDNDVMNGNDIRFYRHVSEEGNDEGGVHECGFWSKYGRSSFSLCLAGRFTISCVSHLGSGCRKFDLGLSRSQ